MQFYSMSHKTVTKTLSLTHWATCLDLSPDGLLLALGSQGNCTLYKALSDNCLITVERVLKLMDTEDGAFQDFTGHHDTLNKLKFCPNGKQLISVSNSSLHIWNITL